MAWRLGLLALGLLACEVAPVQAQPARLSETGLLAPVAPERPVTPGASAASTASALPARLAPDLIAFTPQYALWSDGASKRRWLRLPPGTAIDARDADAWRFPRGTQVWKEFSLAGRPVETRYIELGRDGRWRYATYAWNAEGTDADLVPARGNAAWPVAAAPGGRYALPSVADCHACHESDVVPVLGFSALQLSPARDERGAGAATAGAASAAVAAVTAHTAAGSQGSAGMADMADLRRLVAAGRLRGLDPALLATPPRIAAASADERAALGYLHANCGHCHNRSGNQVPLPLTLAQRVRDASASRAEVLASTVDATARFRLPGAIEPHDPVIAPGEPARSLLVTRMASRDPRVQMPPLGTVLADEEGLALVRRWITHDPDLERRVRP